MESGAVQTKLENQTPFNGKGKIMEKKITMIGFIEFAVGFIVCLTNTANYALEGNFTTAIILLGATLVFAIGSIKFWNVLKTQEHV